MFENERGEIKQIKLTTERIELINQSLELFKSIKKINDSKFASKSSMICALIEDILDSINKEDFQKADVDKEDKWFR